MIHTRLLLVAAALAGSAEIAHAGSCSRSGDEIIASCDAALGGSGLLMTTARGWCYLLNAIDCPSS